MDFIQAGLVILAFAAIRFILPVIILFLLGTWVNRRYTYSF